MSNALKAVKKVINQAGEFSLSHKRVLRNAFEKAFGSAEAAGSGITSASGGFCQTSVVRAGNLVTTTIVLDMTGLTSAATDADIIGVNDAANCYLTRLLEPVNGTIIGGSMKCVEAPATGEIDFDLYSADEGTGTENALITALTETKLVDSGGDWTDNREIGLTAVPDASANEFLYLAVGTASTPTAGVYTAGKFVITLYGTA
jgi:hypothetical protein